MKKIMVSLIMAFISTLASSQPLTATFETDTMTVERDKVNDLTINSIKVNVNGINQGGGSSNTINFAILAAPATTMPVGSHSLKFASVNVVIGSSQVNCPVDIIHGTNSGGNVLYISIQLSYNNPTAQNDTIVLKVVEKKKEEKEEEKEKKVSTLFGRNRIMLLNAYNFDFGSTSLKSNYVGHLNLFAPSLSEGKNKRWGFNTGIMKINYGQKDSANTGGSSLPENVLLSPFDTIKAGLKYLREINSYKTEKSNVVWSFYVQPTYELTSESKNQHIYAHLHMELLASKWSATTTIVNLKRDTSVLPQNFAPAVFRSNLNSSSTYTINSLSGYFGVGLTFDLKPWDGGGFFFQPTVGFTSNTPSLSSVDITTGLPSSFIIKKSGNQRTWRTFYLVRANYRHALSKDATVVIGMDIRGLFPLYSPQYAAYAGLNLGLDSILSLIKDKK